jgi:hypothetical protein
VHTLMVAVSILWFFAGNGLIYGQSSQVQIGQSGDYLQLQRQSDGKTVSHYLPLYRKGNIRYFSAGVGLEEREATYPPFSLKLVFTAGGKPYLTGVEVDIRAVDHEAAIHIAKNQVDGPWLFVDLPTGSYDITATYGTAQRALHGVPIVAEKQKTLYLRWSEDAGVTLDVPNE